MTILQQINNYWQIILAVAAIVWALVSMYWKVNRHEEQINEAEGRLTLLESSSDSFREEIKVSVQRIETTMDFIKQAIVELKSKA